MSAAGQRKIRLALVAGAYLLAAMGVVRATFVDRRSEFDAAFGTILAVLVAMACVADSAALGHPIVHGARLPLMAIWPIAAPIYVLRSRGWWGLALLLVHVGILFAIVVACVIVRVVIEVLG